MITGLAHIGVAVTELEPAIGLWCRLTGGRLVHREEVHSQRVDVAVIEIGTLRVELLCATSDDSPIARFISAKGPGIHHIGLRSTDAQEDLDRLKRAGIRLIDEQSRPGAESARVGFIHPKAADGVLLEIVEPPPE